MSTAIQPERVLKELAELWVSLGKESDPAHSSGVLRACAMTLIALVEESEDPSDVWSTMAALMPEHPSRAIVIRFRPSAARELSSRVFSQCWMPFGHRRQICCEQIEITASDASLSDLAAVVLPLAVADLPVVLWCRSARLFGLADFPQLAKIAHKILLDSAGFADAAAILAAMRQKAAHVWGDLAWTRLTHVREQIAQIFESRNYLAQLPEVTEVTIGFGAPTPPTGAFYLAAWILDCLENAGAHPRIHWQPGSGGTSRYISRVELAAAKEDGLRVTIDISGAERPGSEMRIGSLATHTILPPENDYTLLREELTIPAHDQVFEKSLKRAASLAGEAK